LFTIEKIPAKRRLILTSSAGDRQDEIILEQMRLLAEHFDHGVIYQDLCQRNRKDGEVIELIRQGFSKGKRMTNIDEVYHEQKAIEHIILISQPGDLCLLLIDDVDNSLRNIDNFVQESLI
jgi:cyanophycin synthetase